MGTGRCYEQNASHSFKTLKAVPPGCNGLFQLPPAVRPERDGTITEKEKEHSTNEKWRGRGGRNEIIHLTGLFKQISSNVENNGTTPLSQIKRNSKSIPDSFFFCHNYTTSSKLTIKNNKPGMVHH